MLTKRSDNKPPRGKQRLNCADAHLTTNGDCTITALDVEPHEHIAEGSPIATRRFAAISIQKCAVSAVEMVLGLRGGRSHRTPPADDAKACINKVALMNWR